MNPFDTALPRSLVRIAQSPGRARGGVRLIMNKRIEYRILKSGEIIRSTDQFYGFLFASGSLEKGWRPTGAFGQHYSSMRHLRHRRRIKTRKK